VIGAYRIRFWTFEVDRHPQTEYYVITVYSQDAKDALTIARLRIRRKFGQSRTKGGGAQRWEIEDIFDEGGPAPRDPSTVIRREV